MKKKQPDTAENAVDAGGAPLRREMFIRSGGTVTIQPEEQSTEPPTEQHEVNDHAG